MPAGSSFFHCDFPFFPSLSFPYQSCTCQCCSYDITYDVTGLQLKYMNDYEYQFKFIMIGDSSVGKSCLMLRFLEDVFKNQHEPTLGVEFGSKTTLIQNKKIRLQIWDTAGQESFKAITRAYYKGSIASLVVFDITNQSSFNNIQHWLKEIKTHSHQKMRIVLIGNKCDLSSHREVSQERIKQFLKESGIEKYYETSALNGTNIAKPFLELGEAIMSEISSGALVPSELSANGIKTKHEKKNVHLMPINPAEKVVEKERCAC